MPQIAQRTPDISIDQIDRILITKDLIQIQIGKEIYDFPKDCLDYEKLVNDLIELWTNSAIEELRQKIGHDLKIEGRVNNFLGLRDLSTDKIYFVNSYFEIEKDGSRVFEKAYFHFPK